MKYQYIILRYNHDTLRDETFNVGILLYSVEANYVGFKSRANLSELKKIFPTFEANKLRSYLAKLENTFDLQSKEVASNSLFKAKDIVALAHEIIQPDDSSIHWGRIGSGVSSDLLTTLEDLSVRYVQQHYSDDQYHSKSDSHVWSKFSKELKRENLLDMFTPKTIQVKGVAQTYDHTYQNGLLHCLQPLSLDLASEDHMIAKALKETGRYFLVKEQKNGPKVAMYYLLGTPGRSELKNNFEDVIKLLAVDENVKIFTEDQAAKLPEVLAQNIKPH